MKRLSCCALEDDGALWKCTCSKRHYMTLNINFSVLLGRGGFGAMRKRTKGNAVESLSVRCRRAQNASILFHSRWSNEGVGTEKGSEEFNEIKTDRVTLQIHFFNAAT